MTAFWSRYPLSVPQAMVDATMSHRLVIGIRPPVPVREALIDTTEAPDGALQGDEQLRTSDAVFQVELVRNLARLTGIKLS